MTSLGSKLLGSRRNTIRAARALAALALVFAGAACSGGGSSAPGASSPRFTYTGPTTWTITGPQGGPFVNTSMDFLLENHGADPVDWSASSVPAFVQLDLTSGSIPANSQTSIHATLDSAMAQSLPVGNSNGTLSFHNDTAAQADVDVDCTLSISTAGLSVQVLPTTNFTSSGPAGGPFSPASTVYTLTNLGTAPLAWESTTGNSWATATPSSGQLASGESVPVTVGIDDSMTTAMAPGMYWSYVDFRDGVNHATLDSRDIGMSVMGGGASAGWTVFTPSADTRTVYVSSSLGNDSNNGLSEAAPKRTIAAGKALMRDNFPDWLLLKCGDTWDEPIGTWPNSGRSLTEPTLISSYGTGERPFLRTGTSDGVVPAYLTNPNYVSIVG